MQITLPPLPWAEDALEPHVSAETVHYHYDKHHRGYVDALAKTLSAERTEAGTLEGLLRSASGKTYDLAAQVWNHTFYWESMTPNGGGTPNGALARAIDAAFGSFSAFHRMFLDAATSEFGSGWAWLCWDPEHARLAVVSTTDAKNPMTTGLIPLLACDVWEHAYYLDYRNERASYVTVFLERLIDWESVTIRAGATRALG